MTPTRAALATLDLQATRLRRPPVLPISPLCAKPPSWLGSVTNGFAEPSVSWDPEELRRWLLRCCEARDYDALIEVPRRLDRAPLVLWGGREPAVRFPGLVDCLLARVPHRPRLAINLVGSWLEHFEPRDAVFREIGDALVRLVSGDPHRRLIVWRDAHRRYQVFSTNTGPMRIAEALLHEADPVAVLADIGMDHAGRASGHYFREIVLHLLDRLPRELSGANASRIWERASGLLSGAAGAAFGSPEATSLEMKGRLARATLTPWVDGSARASAPREAVKGFLMSRIGDPRLYPERWMQAGEACTGVMRSWVAADTLEAFFTLIGEDTDDEQWERRRDFWRACLRKAPNTEVWVVLGDGLESRARMVPALRDAYGHHAIVGKAEQAALLIKVRGLVFSEWSHKGALRAYEAADRDAPALYVRKRGHYHGNKREPVGCLMLDSLSFPHHPVKGRGGSLDGRGLWHRDPDAGFWQACAAKLLEARTGIRLEPRDYL